MTVTMAVPMTMSMVVMSMVMVMGDVGHENDLAVLVDLPVMVV